MAMMKTTAAAAAVVVVEARFNNTHSPKIYDHTIANSFIFSQEHTRIHTHTHTLTAHWHYKNHVQLLWFFWYRCCQCRCNSRRCCCFCWCVIIILFAQQKVEEKKLPRCKLPAQCVNENCFFKCICLSKCVVRACVCCYLFLLFALIWGQSYLSN